MLLGGSLMGYEKSEACVVFSFVFLVGNGLLL